MDPEKERKEKCCPDEELENRTEEEQEEPCC